MPGPDQPAVGGVVADLLDATGGYHSINRNVRNDGERITCEWHDRVVTDDDGETVGIYSQFQDISERTEREQELEAERDFIEQALNALNDVLYVVGTDGNLRRWNEQVSSVTGYTDDQLGEMQAISVFPDDERAQVADAIEETFATGEATVDADLLAADGDRIPNEFTGSRLTDTEGEVVGLIGIGREGTERNRRERALERRNERLERFASVVSHDLRNPLNVAEGRLGLAREECDSDHLDDAANAVDRSLRLIDDLLTLAREGEDVSTVEPVGLRETIEGCWQTVQTGDATLVSEIDRTIRADPSRLHQLLGNLFRNAVEHGGDDVTITIGALDDGFYVSDDGSGIPDTDREQVFEPEYSTADGGTGFGLHIVAEVVEAHGCDTGISASEAGGTRFEITGVEWAS